MLYWLLLYNNLNQPYNTYVPSFLKLPPTPQLHLFPPDYHTVLCWAPCGGGLVAKLCSTLATPWTVTHQAPLFPWDSAGKNTGVGCHFLLGKWIFPTQELNTDLLHCRRILYQLSYKSLYYIANFHWLSVLHMAICFNTTTSVFPTIFFLLCPNSLWLCFYSCPSSRFISTIFLESIYICVLMYDIWFSLSDLLHSV